MNVEGKWGSMPLRTARVTGADRGGLFVKQDLGQRRWLVFTRRIMEDYDHPDRLADEYPSVRPL